MKKHQKLDFAVFIFIFCLLFDKLSADIEIDFENKENPGIWYQKDFAEITDDPSKVIEGKRSLLVSSTGKKIFFSTIKLTPYSRYQFSFDWKVIEGDPEISISFNQAEKGPLRKDYVVAGSSRKGKMTGGCRFSAKKSPVNLGFFIKGPGSVCLDNLKVTRTAVRLPSSLKPVYMAAFEEGEKIENDGRISEIAQGRLNIDKKEIEWGAVLNTGFKLKPGKEYMLVFEYEIKECIPENKIIVRVDSEKLNKKTVWESISNLNKGKTLEMITFVADQAADDQKLSLTVAGKGMKGWIDNVKLYELP